MKRGPLRTLVIILGILVATIAVSFLLQLRDSLLDRLPGLPEQGPTQNAEVPDFTLETVDGKTVSLSDYRGRPVVINFWATWCAPCREEMPLLQETYDAHRDDGLVVIGVNVRETPEKVKRFLAEVGVEFPVLLDSEGAAGKPLPCYQPAADVFCRPRGQTQNSRGWWHDRGCSRRTLGENSLIRS